MKQPIAAESERQQNSMQQHKPTGTSGSQAFVDNRESTQQMRQLMAAMKNSPQAIAQRKLSEQIRNSPRMMVQRQQFAKITGAALQRVASEEEPLQGKFAPESTAQREQQPADKPNNTGLPDNLKSGIESLSGVSMDSVRVHYNSSQPEQLNALAYAQGTDIHVAQGQEQHLPHEAWHVVQQAQGRVQPTMQMKEGTSINDDQGLKREADVMGAKAAQMMQNESISSQCMDNVVPSSTVQRAEVPEDILDHQAELDDVINDIGEIQGPHGGTDEDLEDTIDGAENWASETRYAAKRKYVEYNRASEAYDRGAKNILLGEDTTMQSDIEYEEGNQWVWEESKLVNGSWPQFGVNVLAAREQLARRTEKGGKGVASIMLSKDFYDKAYDELGLDENTVGTRCVEYLTKTMRKKFPSQKGTTFIVKLISYKGSQVEYDVTKWHR